MANEQREHACVRPLHHGLAGMHSEQREPAQLVGAEENEKSYDGDYEILKFIQSGAEADGMLFRQPGVSRRQEILSPSGKQ